MSVTRRQGLLAMVATLAGIVLNGFGLGRLRAIARSLREPQAETDRGTGHVTRGQRDYGLGPAPHSVKRHG
jgi:hypothetical protein